MPRLHAFRAQHLLTQAEPEDRSPSTDLPERELVRRAAGGDRAALSDLVAQHRAPVYRFARRLTRNAEVAADVLQDTFVTALEQLGGWRGSGSFRGWLLAIARSRVLMDKRRQSASPEQPSNDRPLEELGLLAGWGSPLDPEELTGRTEERSHLEQALAKLPETEREVLLLRDVEGLSGDDTAAALGVSIAAMKSRLHRARLRLVAELKGVHHGG